MARGEIEMDTENPAARAERLAGPGQEVDIILGAIEKWSPEDKRIALGVCEHKLNVARLAAVEEARADRLGRRAERLEKRRQHLENAVKS